MRQGLRENHGLQSEISVLGLTSRMGPDIEMCSVEFLVSLHENFIFVGI